MDAAPAEDEQGGVDAIDPAIVRRPWHGNGASRVSWRTLMLSSVTGWRTLAMGILLVDWSRTGPVYSVNGARIWRAGVGGAATEAHHHPLVAGRGRTASTLPWLTSGCR